MPSRGPKRCEVAEERRTGWDGARQKRTAAATAERARRRDTGQPGGAVARQMGRAPSVLLSLVLLDTATYTGGREGRDDDAAFAPAPVPYGRRPSLRCVTRLAVCRDGRVRVGHFGREVMAPQQGRLKLCKRRKFWFTNSKTGNVIANTLFKVRTTCHERRVVTGSVIEARLLALQVVCPLVSIVARMLFLFLLE